MENRREICRLCRRFDSNSISLLSEEKYWGFTLCEKLKEVTQIEISATDVFPTTACPLCVWNINFAFKFVVDCKRTQKWFKESLSEKEYMEYSMGSTIIPQITMSSQESIHSCKEETFSVHLKEKEFEFVNLEEGIDPSRDCVSSPPLDHSVGSDNAETPDCPIKESRVSKKKKGPKKKKRAPNGEYICEPCGKIFGWKFLLRDHILIHFNKAKPFKCKLCPKKYIKKNILRDHVKLVHEGEKRHICEICGKDFRSFANLKDHLMLHTGEKPYQCSSCPRRFSRITNMRTHENIHKKQRCICPTCGKSYASKYVLHEHQLIHKGIKKHECDVCEKKFLTKAGLLDHSRTHTGEQPWNCPYCSRTFAQRNSMRSHIKTHPEATTFPCTFCKKKYLRKDVLEMHLQTHKPMDLSAEFKEREQETNLKSSSS